ncbi:MAG: cytochrome b/b6 domain-containing protein [Chloroflexota bacterium]|nr:cytochrome b/b6 domain-containing protein [Chloroflexota bacterium]
MIGSSIILILLFSVLFTDGRIASAKLAPKSPAKTSPIHPTFPLLDLDGENILSSGKPVSTMSTCGTCHDTSFIEEHSFHASVGLNDFTEPGQVPEGRPWDTSPGYFGKWNPILYRYLSPAADELLDLGTAAWIQNFGARHVGGGPAVYSRDGNPLLELHSAEGDPETYVLSEDSSNPVPWDWQESGVVEMNCFLCHTPAPNNDARIQVLNSGEFQWANTATLLGTGIVDQVNLEYLWNESAFDENGELKEEFVAIQDPTNENCGQCHGLVHDELDSPLITSGCSPDKWSTITTGQIITGQRMSDTGMNLADKEELTRSWDIHAERLLQCTDCHFSLNNPVYYVESTELKPDHLTFDPRRLDIGEYLFQPLHQFARGQSAQTTVAPEMKDTMRRCESCHSIEAAHEWLPYKERHVEAISCESCHIPKMYSNALQQDDWTVIKLDSTPIKDCRGLEGDPESINSLITGFEPVLLQRQELNGDEKLAPYNLITSWYWVYGDPPRPVRLVDLEAAWLDDGGYHPEIIAVFDENGDGEIVEGELVLDTPEKQSLIADRLSDQGLDKPRISGEIQPYSINHNVTHGEWATKDCQTCHSEDSRITQPFQLSSYIPGNVMPEFVKDINVTIDGDLYTTPEGELYYQPGSDSSSLYILGHNNVHWVDLLGALIFVGVLLGIFVHGGIRFLVSRRQPNHEPDIELVYMYSTYERLWHWLQTAVIIILLFTGLIIHKPDIFGIFNFRYVVSVHNIMAAILVINAVLSLFYHMASGEIRQFIPRPRGFFDQAISQSLYYVRGIFKHEDHPFEKTPDRKLNPLQQITYFSILNVLLPLQILTGAMMWGAQRWPGLTEALGGLPFLGPFHSLIAWLFASFIVLHVYLTTTGPKPLTGINAMITGWENMEIHTPVEEVTD